MTTGDSWERLSDAIDGPFERDIVDDVDDVDDVDYVDYVDDEIGRAHV